MMVWIGSEVADAFPVGHTKSYIKVLVKGEESLRGRRVVVKITEVHRFHVVGDVVDANPSFVGPSCSPDELDEQMRVIYGSAVCSTKKSIETD